MRYIRPYLKNCKDTSCKAKTKIGDWMLSCPDFLSLKTMLAQMSGLPDHYLNGILY